MICLACKHQHDRMMRCEMARRIREARATTVVDKIADGSRHGKYADRERRRLYQREWARRKRESCAK